MDWLKRAWKAGKAANDAYGFVTSEPIKLLVWPLATAAVTTAWGLLSAVPAPYVFAASSVVFAAVATGLLRLDEWRERTNPSGRLTLETVFFAPETEERSGDVRLRTIQLGIEFKNRAAFTIHYQVEEFEAQIMGRVAMEAPRPGAVADVPAGDITTYRDRVIEVDAPMPKGFSEGRVKFKAAYWKTPRRKFRIERNLRIYLRRDPESGALGLSSSIE